MTTPDTATETEDEFPAIEMAECPLNITGDSVDVCDACQ